MRVRVRFRYDAVTGQVSYFQVDDVTGAPPEADHDAIHDRITTEIADVVERGALIEEVISGLPPVTRARTGPGTATSAETDPGGTVEEPGRDV